MTKKRDPTGVDRGARDVDGRKRGEIGQGKRWQKRDRGKGMKGPTGTWGAGRGRQESECRTGGGGRRN